MICRRYFKTIGLLAFATFVQIAGSRYAQAACELFVTTTIENGGIIRMSTAGDMPRPLNVPSTPKRIAIISYPTPQLFWIQESDHNIYTSATDGTGYRILQTVDDYPTALTVYANTLYISEHSADPLELGASKVLMMNADGGGMQVIVAGQNYITGITIQSYGTSSFLMWTTLTEQDQPVSHGAVYSSNLDGSNVRLSYDLNARSADGGFGGSSYPVDIDGGYLGPYIADNISSDPAGPHVVYGNVGSSGAVTFSGVKNRLTSLAADYSFTRLFVSTAENGISNLSPVVEPSQIKVTSLTGGGMALNNGPNCFRTKNLTGSSLTDFVVFRPSNGRWYIRSNNGPNEPEVITPFGVQWGLPGDIPKILNFSGDLVADIAVFRPKEGNWYICNSWHGEACVATQVVQFGLPGDIPIAADFDGDGLSDLTVYRPKEGRWYIRYSRTQKIGTVDWGLPGDIPIVNRSGDYNDSQLVWRPSTGYWYDLVGGSNFGVRQWGLKGDVPMYGLYGPPGGMYYVPAHLVVFRPSNSTWYICASAFGGINCEANGFVQFGLPKDIPVRGNFFKEPSIASDNILDFAVFRPSEGAWYFNNQYVYGSPAMRVQWGLPGDIPVTN